MKTAICCFSAHHGNTLRFLEGMSEGNEVGLIGGRCLQSARGFYASLEARLRDA